MDEVRLDLVADEEVVEPSLSSGDGAGKLHQTLLGGQIGALFGGAKGMPGAPRGARRSSALKRSRGSER
jgi:hypothetical protein